MEIVHGLTSETGHLVAGRRFLLRIDGRDADILHLSHLNDGFDRVTWRRFEVWILLLQMIGNAAVILGDLVKVSANENPDLEQFNAKNTTPHRERRNLSLEMGKFPSFYTKFRAHSTASSSFPIETDIQLYFSQFNFFVFLIRMTLDSMLHQFLCNKCEIPIT